MVEPIQATTEILPSGYKKLLKMAIIGGELPTNRFCGLVHPNYKWINPLLIPFITGVITHLRAVG